MVNYFPISSPLIYLLEINICVVIFLTLFFGAALIALSKNSSYLARVYQRNWNTAYITDVMVAYNLTCPTGYEVQGIGMWSGFGNGTCLCTDQQFQITGEERDDCDDFSREMGLKCVDMPPSGPTMLNYYKNTSFCVKRSNDTFMDLWKRVEDYVQQQQINNNNTHNGDHEEGNLNPYITMLKGRAPPGFIDPNAIVDIRIVDENLFSLNEIKNIYHFDLSGYNAIETLGNPNYILYFKRLGDDWTPNIPNGTIFDANRIIVDIHLFNELWCGYLDLSSPLAYPSTLTDLDFGGYEYCENFYQRGDENEDDDKVQPSMYYNDGFKRTQRINFQFDPTVSLNDFYDSNGVTKYYQQLQNVNMQSNQTFEVYTQNNVYGDFEPILVAQNYFYGIGCPKMDSIDDHIDKMDKGTKLRMVAQGFFACCFIQMLFLFFYFPLKSKCCSNRGGCCNLVRMFCIFAIIIFSLLNSILMIYYGATAYSTRKYLNDFTFYCQEDFTNRSGNNGAKASSLELRYYQDLEHPMRLSFCLVVGCLWNFIVLACYFFALCCMKRQNLENESGSTANNQPVSIEFVQNHPDSADKTSNRGEGFKKVMDKSEVSHIPHQQILDE